MVIDDDLDLRESIIEILEESNFTVIGCESAEEAMQKIKLDTPQLIIVDNMMPGMGGMAFIPLVKNKYPSIIIHPVRDSELLPPDLGTRGNQSLTSHHNRSNTSVSTLCSYNKESKLVCVINAER